MQTNLLACPRNLTQCELFESRVLTFANINSKPWQKKILSIDGNNNSHADPTQQPVDGEPRRVIDIAPFWLIRSTNESCAFKTCGFNKDMHWRAYTLGGYKDSITFATNICDFQIYHEPSKRVFKIPISIIFSKSMTVRMKITSEMEVSCFPTQLP